MLEWVRLNGHLSARSNVAKSETTDTAGRWELRPGFSKDDQWFVVFGHEHAGRFPSVREAKAWCESQEQATQTSEQLPKVGSVWGVLGQNDALVLVDGVVDGRVEYDVFGNETTSSKLVSDWHAWVSETGAVDLIADREALVQRAEAAEKEVQGVIDCIPKDCVVQSREGGGHEDIFGTLAISVSKLRSRMEAAEKERDELKRQHENLERYSDNRRRAALAAGWQPGEYSVTGFIAKLAKERDDLLAEVARLKSPVEGEPEWVEAVEKSLADDAQGGYLGDEIAT